MIEQAIGIKWLDSKSKFQRWIGNFSLGKSIIGLIQTLNRPFVVYSPSDSDYLHYDWLNWAPRISLHPLELMNIFEGKLNLRDVLLENTTSNILLGVRMGYTILDQESHRQTLMVFKYDKKKNILFWQDPRGGNHDVTKLRETNGSLTPFGSKMQYASELYIFQLQHCKRTN